MTILLATDHYLPTINGIAIHVDLLAKELRKRGHAVYILTAYCPGQEQSEYLIPAPSLPLIGRGDERVVIPFSPSTVQRLREIDFDIIHDHLFLTSFLSGVIAKEKHLPYLVSYHTIFITVTRRSLPFLPKGVTQYLADKLAFWYFNKFTHIIAVSRKPLLSLQKIHIKPPITIVHNGVSPLPPKKAKKYPWYDPKKRYIALTGRVDSTKNVQVALQAFFLTHKKYPDTHLLVIGDGPERKKFEAYTKEQKMDEHVSFLGMQPRDEFPSIYQYVDLGILASLEDTLSLVLIEQAMSGLPFAIVHDEGVIEVAQPGINALTTPNSPKALSDAMINVLTDEKLRQKFSKNSLKIAKEFSQTQAVDEIEALYREEIKKLKA